MGEWDRDESRGAMITLPNVDSRLAQGRLVVPRSNDESFEHIRRKPLLAALVLPIHRNSCWHEMNSKIREGERERDAMRRADCETSMERRVDRLPSAATKRLALMG